LQIHFFDDEMDAALGGTHPAFDAAVARSSNWPHDGECESDLLYPLGMP